MGAFVVLWATERLYIIGAFKEVLALRDFLSPSYHQVEAGVISGLTLDLAVRLKLPNPIGTL
jgi:hypothetical protein